MSPSSLTTNKLPPTDALEDIRVVLHVERRRRALALECAVRDGQDARVEPARGRARVLRRDLHDAVDPFEEGELDRVRGGRVGDDGAVARGRDPSERRNEERAGARSGENAPRGVEADSWLARDFVLADADLRAVYEARDIRGLSERAGDEGACGCGLSGGSSGEL